MFYGRVIIFCADSLRISNARFTKQNLGVSATIGQFCRTFVGFVVDPRDCLSRYVDGGGNGRTEARRMNGGRAIAASQQHRMRLPASADMKPHCTAMWNNWNRTSGDCPLHYTRSDAARDGGCVGVATAPVNRLRQALGNCRRRVWIRSEFCGSKLIRLNG